MSAALIIVLIVVGAGLIYFAMQKGKEGSTVAVSSPQKVSPGSSEVPAVSEKSNWLVGKAGDAAGKVFLVGYRTVTIGRAPTNFIQVDDTEASRTHCQITPRDGHLQIVDMNSRNGTFIDGTPTTQGKLMPGGELKVGDAVFVYELRGSYEHDDAMDRKKADSAKFGSTVAAQGQQLDLLIAQALKKHDGDFEAAGKEIGVEGDLLRHIAVDRRVEF